MNERRFPPDFVFGCATSAYQVEGGIENDWTAWEAAGRLKDANARCGQAVDHWNRWQEDFGLLADLGVGAYRFSVEWSRVEPEPGVYDQAALDQYSRMIDALCEIGVEPFVTLLHFTHPPWFHARCPWHGGREAVDRFGSFVEQVAAAFGDRVRYWTVLNEPNVWLGGAYVAGAIPPGEKSLRRMGAAFFNLVRAHAAAHERLSGAGNQIGIAQNQIQFAPARRGHPLDLISASYLAKNFNRAFLDALTSGRARLGAIPGIRMVQDLPEARGTLDFIGINYYSRVFVSVHPLAREKLRIVYEDRLGHGVSDLGWEIFPEGLTRSLLESSRYGLPLYVTENGTDDRDDSRRAAYLHDHLGAVLNAIEQGADVRGYLFWSLLDNFEWLEGYGPRFGLYRVDYETLARTATLAAPLYAQIVRQGALPAERPAETIKPGTGPTSPL